METDADVAMGMLAEMAHDRGQWLTDLWTRALTEGWGDDALLRIARAMPVNSETWSKIAAVSGKLDEAYWKTQLIYDIPADCTIDAVADKLIKVGRGRDLVNWLGQHLHTRPPGGLLVRVAVVFPGQGTQAPGMGAPWHDHPAWKIVEQA